jgi:hypothetical protein
MDTVALWSKRLEILDDFNRTKAEFHEAWLAHSHVVCRLRESINHKPNVGETVTNSLTKEAGRNT